MLYIILTASMNLGIGRRAVVEQQLHHLRVAPLARPHQRGVAVLALLVDRRALIEQPPHPLRVAVAARVMKWGHGHPVINLPKPRRGSGVRASLAFALQPATVHRSS